MHKISSFIGICVIFTLVRSNVLPSLDERYIIHKKKWEACCRNNLCIGPSCYILIRRPSTWAAIRQRCQGKYPDLPTSIDSFQIRNKIDLLNISNIIMTNVGLTHKKTIWTSGMICPKTTSKRRLTYFTKWISTNDPFPDWLKKEIKWPKDSFLEKTEGCQFLVFSPATKVSELKYDFQDQSSRHAGVCEFVLPKYIPISFSTESTLDSDYFEANLSTSDIMKPAFKRPTELIKDFTTREQTESSYRQSTGNKNEKEISASAITKINSSYTTLPSTKSNGYCKGKVAAGILWPDTLAGITVKQRCPKGMNGYAQWNCNELTLKFMPETPHVENCKHIWITDLEEHVKNGRDAVQISSELAQKTKKQIMSHGDIIALVDLSLQILHLFSKQKESKNSEEYERDIKPYVFTGSMVFSMSNILRAEIKEAWETLPASHQTRAASKILQIVTVIGSHLSCIRKSNRKLQFTIASDNIGLQTFILNKEQSLNSPIVFPQRVQGVEVNSSLIVPTNLVWKKPYTACKKYNTAVGVIYKRVGDFLNDQSLSGSHAKVVTQVISFSMNNNSKTMLLPRGKWVTLTLRHRVPAYFKSQHLRCVFWNFSKQTYGQWDDDGCFLVSANKTHITCCCNHLTNFAVLMDVYNNVEGNSILSMMTYICCGMSCVSLVITLFCFLSIRTLHGRRSIITGNLCFSLLITNLLVIFGLDQTENQIICATIAGLLHFWILSAFCWMLIEGYHLYKMVVLVFERGHILSVKAYYFIAYGIPLIIVSISAGIRSDDYKGHSYCWLSPNDGLIWSFVGPACVIILINIFIFIMTLRSASNVRIKREQSTIKKIKSWARGSMSVMCLLGLTWCLGLFYIDEKLKIFSYIFTVLNGMQGVFIFFFHIILNDKSSTFFNCKRSKQERWNKCLSQTLSHHLHSKASTRTSINSMGCVSCSTSVPNSSKQSNVPTLQNNLNGNHYGTKSKLKYKKKWNSENKAAYMKENTIHTISENGQPIEAQSYHSKIRSHSFPE